MIDELNVVNACLGSIGELPVVELTDDHPLIAAARSRLADALVQESHIKWWFNTDWETLRVANDHFIYTPADAVSVYPYRRPDLIQRGRRLWDRVNSTYEMQGPVLAIVVRNLPLEDLPPQVALLVKYATVQLFQQDYDADEAKKADVAQAYTKAFVTCNAEHARQVQLNGLETLFTGRERGRLRPRQSSGIPVR